jgi:methanogenic corrinoid protein MtbC1
MVPSPGGTAFLTRSDVSKPEERRKEGRNRHRATTEIGKPDTTYGKEEDAMSQELVDALTDMREEDALRIANEMLASGTDPMQVLDACKEALDIIGQRFAAGQAFVPELVMAGEMTGEITAAVKPHLRGEAPTNVLGKVLMGTVVGDIHDIGKEVVVFMLEANGFEVQDLGVDVPPAAFVGAIRENQPDVVGMSGLLTISFEGMKKTVDAIREAGLRDQVKIMIGGSPVDDLAQEYTGADAWGRDAMTAVSLAKEWTGVS